MKPVSYTHLDVYKRQPYNLGSWVHIDEPAEYPGYERVLQPDGPIFFAGDHVSHLVGWQEGAALSAHRAIAMLGQSQSAQLYSQ